MICSEYSNNSPNEPFSHRRVSIAAGRWNTPSVVISLVTARRKVEKLYGIELGVPDIDSTVLRTVTLLQHTTQYISNKITTTSEVHVHQSLQ